MILLITLLIFSIRGKDCAVLIPSSSDFENNISINSFPNNATEKFSDIARNFSGSNAGNEKDNSKFYQPDNEDISQITSQSGSPISLQKGNSEIVTDKVETRLSEYTQVQPEDALRKFKLALGNMLKSQIHAFIVQKFSLFRDINRIDSDNIQWPLNENVVRSLKASGRSIKSEHSHSTELVASARQLLFHPYLPYGKDVPPDEKISIQDVLPVKMVKFIKSMVEEAPWEHMFMKMVRMVVDQFVDKIIEKMFANKDEGDKWRSEEGNFKIPLLNAFSRTRRSIGQKKPKQDSEWTGSDISLANRISKEDRVKPKEEEEEESWLDSVLDYFFPDNPDLDLPEDFGIDDIVRILESPRKKRDVNDVIHSEKDEKNGDQMSDIIRQFLLRYSKFQAGFPPSETDNNLIRESAVLSKSHLNEKDLREKEDISLKLPGQPSDEALTSNEEDSLYEFGDDDGDFDDEETPDVEAAFSELPSGSWLTLEEDVNPDTEKSVKRSKRSAFEDSERSKDSNRLWQAGRKSKPAGLKNRDECSLRRACNAGRLLSRLPSVQDITLQLKGYNEEPHWDALLWGMTKKKCSRIFCKRQRSPKGSKHHWHSSEKRHHKKNVPATRAERNWFEESDLTTVFPFEI